MGVLDRAYSQPVETDGWPAYLYKYKPLRTDLDLSRVLEILDGQLYAAHKDSFNDPFDCAPVLKVIASHKALDDHVKGVVNRGSVGQSRRERRHRLKDARKNARQSGAEQLARNAIRQSYDDAGIISLTTHPDNLLMWGHYGSEYSGVCIRFDLRGRLADFRCAFPVGYSIERPVLHYPITDAEELIDKCFLTKAKCWEYESEWRIIDRDGPGLKSFRPESINGVVLGARIADVHRQAILGHLAKRPERKADVYQAELDDDLYRMNLIAI